MPARRPLTRGERPIPGPEPEPGEAEDRQARSTPDADEQSDRRRRALPAILAALLLAAGLARAVPTLAQVGRRITFPYDFLIWADDYVMTELIKLRLGAPLYGPVGDVDSFVYAPGVPLLHRALLAPLHLDLSLLANRILSQLWLALAIAVSVLTAASLRRAERGGVAGKAAFAAGAAVALTLAAYASPVADSLHPGALEMFVLAIGAYVAARWPTLGWGPRIAALCLLPGAALCAKQAGASLGLALAAVALSSREPWSRRLALAGLTVVSIGAALAALQLGTRGAFWLWGYVIPTRQPLDAGKLLALPGWVLRTLSPLSALVLLAAIRAWRRPERRGSKARARSRAAEERCAWLRVAAVPLAYLPLGGLGYLKAMGGTNNFAVPIFFGTLLVLPMLGDAIARAADGPAFAGEKPVAGALLVAALAVGQLVLWRPFRRVPAAIDYEHGSAICDMIIERVGCGERVLVDQGAACVARALDRTPAAAATQRTFDRANSWAELMFAELDDQAGTEARVRAGYYDVIIHHHWDPGYFDSGVRLAVRDGYRVFGVVPPGQQGGNLWRDSWQNLADITFFMERSSETGRHAPRAGTGCPRTPG